MLLYDIDFWHLTLPLLIFLEEKRNSGNAYFMEASILLLQISCKYISGVNIL